MSNAKMLCQTHISAMQSVLFAKKMDAQQLEIGIKKSQNDKGHYYVKWTMAIIIA